MNSYQPFDKCPGLWAQKWQNLHRRKKIYTNFCQTLLGKKMRKRHLICLVLVGSNCVWDQCYYFTFEIEYRPNKCLLYYSRNCLRILDFLQKKMTAFWDIFLSGTLRIKMQCVHKLIQQNLSKEINKTCAYKNIPKYT